MKPSLAAGVVTWFFTTTGIIGLAALGGWLWGQRTVERSRKAWHLTQVVVAARDLPAGTTFTEADLSLADEPGEFVTADVVPATQRATLVGKTSTFELRARDVITRAYVTAPLPSSCVAEVGAVVRSQPNSQRWEPLLRAFGDRLEADGGH